MIATLRGTILEQLHDAIVLDVGGVGYLVHISIETKARLPKEGETTALYTHLAVRETALDLYGFLGRDELSFFEMLISVSGVGPKTALGILSLADVATLSSAVASGDTSYLTKVSGIGKKSAERIVIELRDKLTARRNGNEDAAHQGEDVDVLEALQSLGYSLRDARDTLKQLGSEPSETPERLKAALQLLSKRS